jgi:hypothetical protein
MNIRHFAQASVNACRLPSSNLVSVSATGSIANAKTVGRHPHRRLQHCKFFIRMTLLYFVNSLLGFFTILLFDAAMLSAQNTTAAEVRDIAGKAYVYAYPLVLIETTRGVLPVNRFTHVPRFPDAKFRQIVRPNADTLYSTAWLDASQEPILIHVPDAGGRFYLLQFMDAWTETFADPGKRTTGTAAQWMAIVGPRWTGNLPEGITRYDSPTNIVWLLGRTQTNGAADYENVHAFQKGMRMMPLSEYPGGEQQLESAKIFGTTTGGTPPDRVKAMLPVDFFSAFTKAMKANPPQAADAAMVSELSRIGIVPGQDFDASKLSADQLQALNEGAHAASARIEQVVTAAAATKPGWGAFQVGMGRYGIDYRRRAIVARLAIGANPPEDAIYISSATDSQGKGLNGSMRYRMHFEKSNLPPVQAFWSITAYDKDGYFIANPVNRYAVGDRDTLKFNPDGSLDIYIQNQNPGADHELNWLPSGDGPFNLTMRLYWPKEPILNGTWHPPALEIEP